VATSDWATEVRAATEKRVRAATEVAAQRASAVPPTLAVVAEAPARRVLGQLQPTSVALRHKPMNGDKISAHKTTLTFPPQAKFTPLTTESRPLPVRVLARTQECCQLELFDDMITTPRQSSRQVSQPLTPFGRCAGALASIPQPSMANSLRLRMNSASTWSLGASEDSPGDAESPWSGGLGNSVVIDVEASHLCMHSASSPTTPFFGGMDYQVGANEVRLAPKECKMAVADACTVALYELQRNTSRIRLATTDEVARLTVTSC